MSLFKTLFGGIGRSEAERLHLRAFQMVEHATRREDFEAALPLLEEASGLAPNHPDVWNELAFVLGHLGRLEDALNAAKKAVDLQPENPKYYNAVIGNRMKLALRSKTRTEARPLLSKTLTDCGQLLNRFPEYPPSHLGRAEILAASGAPESDWEQELDRACTIYEKQGTMGHGGETTGDRLKNVLQNCRIRCLARAQWWSKLPEQ
jgi:tetratricopeptide (TPR) repeat protein